MKGIPAVVPSYGGPQVEAGFNNLYGILSTLFLQAHPIKKGGEMAREKTMPTTLRMSDITGGKLFYYV